MTNIRKIKNSVKPLMMPSQKLNLQEQDIGPKRRVEACHGDILVKSQTFNHWVKRKNQETSLDPILLVNQKGQRVEKDNRRNARNSTLTRTSNIHHSQHQFTLKLQ